MSKNFFILVFFIAFVLNSCSQNSKVGSVTSLDAYVFSDSSYLGKSYNKFNSNGVIIESGYLNKNKRQGAIKFYKNGELDAVKIYNSDSIICNASLDNFKFSSKNIFSNISITTPKSWQVLKSDYPVIFVSHCGDKCRNLNFNPTISVVSDSLKYESDFHKYLIKSTKSLGESLDDFVLVSEGDVSVNEIKSYQITYTFYEGLNLFGGVTTWYRISDGVILMFSGVSLIDSSSSFMEYKCLFQEIAKSLTHNP